MKPSRLIIVASATLGLWAFGVANGHAQPTPSPAPAAAPAIADSQTPPSPPPPPPPPPAPPDASEARKVQQPPQPPQPAGAPKAQAIPPPGPPRTPGQLINVRVDVTVTDQAGVKPPVSRTLSVTVADGENAQVRSNLEAHSGDRPTGFQLDAQPRIVSRPAEGARRGVAGAGSADEARIRLGLILDYNSTDSVTAAGGNSAPARSSIRVRQEVILESGKPLVIAQPVDAVSDRKVTVEVKATILR